VDTGFWDGSSPEDENVFGSNLDRVYRLLVTSIKLNEEPSGRSASVDVGDYYAVNADVLI